MTDHQDDHSGIEPESQDTEAKSERFPELAELEEKIRRRLRSNERFLERFMDEDFDEIEDDEDADVIIDDDDSDLMEEL